MSCCCRIFLVFAVGCLLTAVSAAAGETDDGPHEALAVLARHCLSCHNNIEEEGGYSFQTRQQFLTSELAGSSDDSRLLDAVTSVGDAAPEMPMDAEPLRVEDVEALRSWIAAGTPWPENYELEVPAGGDFDWWLFQPLQRPDVPTFADGSDEANWAQTPIDAFIAQAHQEHGLSHSVEADKQTLIRRLTFDLTGLPPSPEDVEAFVADTDPQAHEKLVDRLLESPRYGERWARHWLDVVKYADTCGYDKDKLRPNAWPYRDYVIRSFNDDKNYTRFVREQVAGDVLFPGEKDGLLALGFIAAGPWDFIGHVEVSESKMDGMVARNLDRDDMVSNTLNTFCSVTIQCARCHNHKFDPFTQEHYYSLQSVFAAVDKAERPLNLTPEQLQQRSEVTNRLGAAELALHEHFVEGLMNGGFELKDLNAKIAKLTEQGNKPEELATTQKRLDDILAIVASPERIKKGEALQAAVDAAKAELEALPEPKVVYAATTQFMPQTNFKPTNGTPRTVHVLHRGNVNTPLHEVTPGVIPLSAETDWHLSLPNGHTEGDRRAALAKWLTRQDNPLTWRSVVNRIWQYHFGNGIAPTPNDLGRMGQLPSHPELLDWLAVEFRDNGQSFMHLHRLILNSAVWKQASVDNAAAAKIDGSNRYLWKQNRRRLSAEEIRDAVLTVSGKMNLEIGGPGFYLFALEKTEHSPHFQYHKFDPEDPASHRRSIYRFIVRSQPNPFMTTMDCADSSQSTPRRNETFTPLQALSLLNNDFTLTMARYFADHVTEAAEDRSARIQRAFELTTGRSPEPDELQPLVGYAEEHGLPATCRLLFNLNEFVFVD